MAANDEHVKTLRLMLKGWIGETLDEPSATAGAEALDAAIRALSAQQPEPDWEAALDRATDRIVAAQQTEAVAFTVVGPDGKSSIGGWMDMRVHEAAKQWAVVRDGHRYAYAYEGAQPQIAVSDSWIKSLADEVAKRHGWPGANDQMLRDFMLAANAVALRPDAGEKDQ